MNCRNTILLQTLLIGVIMVSIKTVQAETLAEVFAEHSLNIDDQYIPNLDKNITSHAEFHSPDYYCLAYYLHIAEDPNRLDSHLHIALLNKTAAQWIHRTLNLNKIFSDNPYYVLGSILQIEMTTNYIFLRGHINPSAAPTLILNKDLTAYDHLDGWIIRMDSKERPIYRQNTVHFAPTSEPLYYRYDPSTKKREPAAKINIGLKDI